MSTVGGGIRGSALVGSSSGSGGGGGGGNMLKAVYDPTNQNTDVFEYVDDAVAAEAVLREAADDLKADITYVDAQIAGAVVGLIEVTFPNIAARNAYNVPSLPFNAFVTNDGDSNWALYKATTTGVGATFIKIIDPDLLNALMSSSAIKSAYESNANTNAFTDALLAKLNAISGTNTGDETGARIGALINSATNYPSPLNADKFGIWDVVNSAFKEVTIANLKSNVFKDTFTLFSQVGSWATPAASTRYYFGITGGIATPLAVITTYLTTLNYSFKICGIVVQHLNNGGTQGGSQNSTIGIRNNTDGIDHPLITTIQTNQANGVVKMFEDQNLNVDIAANKATALYFTTGPLSPLPTNLILRVTLFIQKT